MHILFVGVASKEERESVLLGCRVNGLEHQAILQPFTGTPQGLLGIKRDTPIETVEARTKREVGVLQGLSPAKTLGVVLGAFGATIELTRFGIAQRLRAWHPSIPVLVVEKPNMIKEKSLATTVARAMLCDLKVLSLLRLTSTSSQKDRRLMSTSVRS